MKKLLFTLLAICMCLLALGQNDIPNLTRDIDEVEISPPAFTGITNYIDLASIDANYLQHYLISHIEYPDQAVTCGNEGTEVIKFNVNALGQVTNIDIVNGVCPAIDDEIVRVLESTNGMWKPGKKDGIPVTMEQEVSVVFSLEDNPEKVTEKFLKVATSCFTKGNELFYLKGKSKRAERLYSHGIKYMPYDQSLLIMRGLCRYERGNHEGAREDWTRLFELGTLDLNTEFYAQAEKLEAYKAFVAMLEEK
ncbi:energy transducer TonB [uncultured Draconibacterium sp.]|uniref:energy transducer TonB n=1 Tax=uncultured Draconibacterium sp. TaxID=1573823 RepID=UPI002AA89B0E|nr:energy transducer TonB [uncultured Draconibacterium sp.]